MRQTDPSLPGVLIYEKDELGYINRCDSKGNLLTTASKFAIGCEMKDTTTGNLYINKGTVAVPSWELAITDLPPASIVITKQVTISAADIVGTAAGQLGHASGVVLVADPGATKAIQFLDAILDYDYDTAAYTAGGNVTVNSNGGSALTGVVSAANSLGAAADKIVQFVPLAATATNLTANKGLNLVAASAFTQPGTAAGTVVVTVRYIEISL